MDTEFTCTLYNVHVYMYFAGPYLPLVEYTLITMLYTPIWLHSRDSLRFVFELIFIRPLSLMPASTFDSKTLFIAALSSKIPYINSMNCLLFHFSTNFLCDGIRIQPTATVIHSSRFAVIIVCYRIAKWFGFRTSEWETHTHTRATRPITIQPTQNSFTAVNRP